MANIKTNQIGSSISVLMSIYNEPLTYIKQAIDSMLQQSYPPDEIIIVVDNTSPDEEIVDYLNKLSPIVKVIYNDKNIGLAMSMNKAYSISSGEYIARMDADDIAYPGRFEKELRIIQEFNVDLVCSNYDLIDENSNLIPNNYNTYTNETLQQKLPYSNTIHHPTVLMTRKAFNGVGGYRDFPCSQDYDLWLRMYDHGYKFYIVSEKLLQYRIRTNSTTQKNGMKQSLTIRYIRSLYRERKRTNKDTYSLENYKLYLKKHGYYNERVKKKYESNLQLKTKIDSLRGKAPLKRSFLKAVLFIRSPFHRGVYINNLLNYISEITNH